MGTFILIESMCVHLCVCAGVCASEIGRGRKTERMSHVVSISQSKSQSLVNDSFLSFFSFETGKPAKGRSWNHWSFIQSCQKGE